MVVETARKRTSRTKVEPPSTKECTLDDRLPRSECDGASPTSEIIVQSIRTRWSRESDWQRIFEDRVLGECTCKRTTARGFVEEHVRRGNHRERPFPSARNWRAIFAVIFTKMVVSNHQTKDGNMVVRLENQDLSSNGACSPRARVYVTDDRGNSPGAMKSNEAACNERTPARV